MDEKYFKVGDVVCLKSGGSTMTIIELITSSRKHGTEVMCEWFWEGQNFSSVFCQEALKKQPENTLGFTGDKK